MGQEGAALLLVGNLNLLHCRPFLLMSEHCVGSPYKIATPFSSSRAWILKPKTSTPCLLK